MDAGGNIAKIFILPSAREQSAVYFSSWSSKSGIIKKAETGEASAFS
jgi:hypothetical protein